MSRGVARKDSSFWEWMRTVIEGTGEYRTELLIKHFHRADTLPGPSQPPAENLNLQSAAKVYKLWQAFPSRHKLSSDLSATDSGVSIMELEVAYEHVEMIEP
jgi:phage tail-like protein